jgi:branched-chain amino acid transport system permease protein
VHQKAEKVEIAVPCIVHGLMLSSIYVLVALGFALLVSIMGIFNFAHGAIYMVGGYICYHLTVQFGVNQWLALVLSALIVGLFGLFLEKFCFRRFFGNVNAVIVMSIALILILETTANVLVGGEVRSIPAFVPGIIRAGVLSVSIERVVTFVLGSILLAALTLFIGRAKAGQQMLAVAQDMEGAVLQGISIYRISALACAIGCSLAAIAGSLLGAILSISPFMGGHMLVKAIQLVLISGIGSIGGLLAAGAIVGFVDATVPVFTSASVAQTVSFFIVIVILLLRPKGLFGYELF